MDDASLPFCWQECFFLYLIFLKTAQIVLLGMAVTFVWSAETRAAALTVVFSVRLIRGAIKICMHDFIIMNELCAVLIPEKMKLPAQG